MLSLEVRFTPPTDWNQPTNHANPPERRNSMAQGVGGENAQGASSQENVLLTLLSMAIHALLEKGQPSDHHENATTSPFNQPDTANSTMEGLGNALLKDAIEPLPQNGGQLSQSSLPLQSEVGKLMDSHPESFGTPKTPNSFGENSIPTQHNDSMTLQDEGTRTSNTSIESTMFPKASSNAVVVNEPIVVKSGETFDGAGQTFTASSKLGDGSQSEDQKPIFILEDGASLKNVILGDNGADGVHTYGDAKLDNIHWTNVGEDALTMKKGGLVEISNSSAKHAEDKIFQLNASGTLILNNVQADDFGKLVRTNGGQQGDWNIQLNNVSATNGKHALVQSDSTSVTVTGNNVQTDNVKGMYILPPSASLTLT